jgi:hypothetical protein
MATDETKNHRDTVAYLHDGKLVPLEQMANIAIGSHASTEIAYPAAGSFVQLLIDKYSLNKLKIAYQGGGSDASWMAAYGQGLPDLEQEWLAFLRQE